MSSATFHFDDRVGNRHHLRNGKDAANVIAQGGIPELMFEACQDMHDHLKQLEKQGTIKGLNHQQYVVYHGAKDDQEGSRFRVMTRWSSYSSTPYQKELSGWGTESSSPLLDVPSDLKVNLPQQMYAVNLQIPITCEKAKGSEESLDASDLQMKMEQHQISDDVLWHVKSIESAQIKMDPIYLYRGDFFLKMKVEAFDEAHAKHMVGTPVASFLRKIVTEAGGQPVGAPMTCEVELDTETPDSATKKRPRP